MKPDPNLLVSEVSRHTGKKRMRCLKCNKVAFTLEETAKRAAEQISEREPMKAYKASCGYWHLTRRIR